MSSPPCRVEALPCADPLALPALERELQQRWLVWDAWTAGKRRVDLHPLVLTAAAHHAAIAAATGAFALVAASGERAFADPDERARYRFHPDVERLAAAARAGGSRGGVVSRVDLLLGTDGRFVACEVNADCPGGYNETVALPELSRRAGLRRIEGEGDARRPLRDPTVVAAALADRLVALSGGPGSPKGLVALVFATGYAEDLQICAFLERLVRERGGRTARVAPTALSAELGQGDRVLLRGEPVSVLYRFYPLEYMAGQKNVDALARAAEAGSLASVSTMAAIYSQSKLAMARAPRSAIFPDSASFAEIGPARLLAEREDWVLKRDLSRVGDHVYVGALTKPGDWAEVVAEVERAETLGGQVWIAQRFAPQAEIQTPWGPRLVTLGVYVVDGAFAGYFARLSPTSHCSHDALVVPVFVEEEAAS